MAKGLNWFQARRLAQLDGVPVRREAWRKWLTYQPSVYLWFIHSDGDATSDPPVPPLASHVVKQDEFSGPEFFGEDWTDEGWDVPTVPGDGGNGGNGNGGNGGNDAGDGGDGGTGGDDGSGGDGGSEPPPDDGGGWGGPGNPPGPGGAPGGGGGGGAPGGGGNGPADPDDPVPPANYTPTVTVITSVNMDGPGCIINAQNLVGAVNVNVTVPFGDGRVRLGLISVSFGGAIRQGTHKPGDTQGFQFTSPVNPGGTVTVNATFSDGAGHTWTGSGEDDWPKQCLMPSFAWSGQRTESNICDEPPEGSEDPPPTGTIVERQYNVAGRYAVNPEPGTGKTGTLFAELNAQPSGLVETTVLPANTTTTTDFEVHPPGSITCDVAAGGAISNVTPDKLGLYDSTGDGTTVEGNCTISQASSESGPS